MALLFLVLIGGLLATLMPPSNSWRTVGFARPARVIVLALSTPAPVTVKPQTLLAAAPVIEETPPVIEETPLVVEETRIVELPPEPAPEPMPSAPLASPEELAAPPPVIEAAPIVELPVAEIVPEPETAPPPIIEAAMVVEPAPVVEPVIEPVQLPAAEIAAAPEPAPETAPETAPEPTPETAIAAEPLPVPEAPVQPILVAALPASSVGDEPLPYAAGALAPDEAAAMPGDKPLPSVAEKTPPEAAVTTVQPEPLLDPAKLPPEPPEPPEQIWLAYARPSVEVADQPRVAVVVAGLGLGRAATMAAIQLPGAITLAFASHARDLQEWIDLARAAGHEVLLDIPMEPENYPQIVPGPQALLTSLSAAENVARLDWHLDRASGYVGVTHNMGSRFTASDEHMRPILLALKRRGLMFLDARTSAKSIAASLATSLGLPRAINNRFLDTQASRLAIDRRIDEIERIARRVGFSVAVSHAYPVTIDRLERWTGTLDDKKLALVPISALVNEQQAE